MATNFSPSWGSYVLNQFPSIVMFGMKGFYVSASGAIQGHHCPLVVAFLAFLERNFVILSRNDLKHGTWMHITCNIGELHIHAYFNRVHDFCYSTFRFI